MRQPTSAEVQISESHESRTRNDLLERCTISIAERIKYHARIDSLVQYFSASLANTRFTLFLQLSHGTISPNKDNFLIFRVYTVLGVRMSRPLRRQTPIPLVAEKLAHGLFERTNPRTDCRGPFCGFPQVTRYFAYPQPGSAPGLQLLFLSCSLKLRRLVFSALTYASVPELGDLIWDSMHGMRGMYFPICS